MSTRDAVTRIGIDRRTFIKAAGGALGAAALTGTAACSSEQADGGGAAPTIDPAERVELPEPISDLQFPDPYVGPRAYDRPAFGKSDTTFRVVVPTDVNVVGDWNKNAFSAWLEQRTGVKIEYQAVNITGPDGSQDLSKINAMLSSGDLPDAFMGVGLSSGQISLYGQQGIFIPLDDLIDNYAPMARAMLAESETLKQVAAASDGRLYQFVGTSDCYHCRTTSSKAFIHQGYLDKIGAKMPETTDDFRAVLRELKERNPSGKDDFLPFLGGNPTWDGLDVWFVNPFTYNPGPGWIRLNNGKVDFVANTDEWRQGMAYMRSLYDDGTLTKQSFTIDSTEMVKLGDRGLIGCARSYYWGGFVSVEYDDDALWHQYVPVMPLVGSSGQRHSSENYYTSPVGSLVITSACQRPEQLIQWADYQMDLEAIMRAYDTGGEQGEQWDWAAEGEVGIDERQAVWKALQDYGTTGVVERGWNQNSLMYRSLDFRNAQYADPKQPTFEKDLYQVSVQYSDYSQPMEQQLPPLLFDEESTATVADLSTTIADHVNQSMAKFATAGVEVSDDSVWNEYTATLDKMGLAQYLELYQKAYDERPQ